MTNSDKQTELEKYRDLNLATVDYLTQTLKIKTNDFSSSQHFQKLRTEINESFAKGRLTNLKQWFRDLTEMPRETADLRFNDFIKERTGQEINLHERFEKGISKILNRQKIKTANEYRDVTNKVDYLSQRESADQNLIDELNSLLIDFEKNKK